MTNTGVTNHLWSSGLCIAALLTGAACGMHRGNVADRTYVELGGVSQYVEVTGRSSDSPVLLYLHGGPGWPETPMVRHFNGALQEHFLVATWDQRGSGLSRKAETSAPDLSVSRFVADAHALTQYLKQAYGKQKVYLLAHSWGTVIGIHLVRQYPEDYHAYAAVGQVVHMVRGEELANRYLRESAAEAGDQATLDALDRLNFSGVDGYTGGVSGFIAQRSLLGRYRGQPLGPGFDDLPPEALKGYEDYDWMTPILYAFEQLHDDLLRIDFTAVTTFEVPIHLFAGGHDYNTPSSLAHAYFERIQAPEKAFHLFDDAGHSLLWEQPDRFHRIMVEEVLGGGR